MAQSYPNPEVGVPVASENVYPLRVGITGGVVAGAVMALAMALWGALSGNGLWFPVNMISATVLRGLQDASIAELQQFMPMAAFVGTLIHFATSILLGLIFAIVLPMLPGWSWFWGVVVGLLLWAAAQYAVLPLVNPKMEALVNQPTFILANVAYSVVLGWWVSRAEKAPILRIRMKEEG